VKTDIGASRRIIVGKRKDAERSGIGIGITGIARSSSIVGRRISSFPLSEIALSATVMIGTTDPIGTIVIIIGVSTGQLVGERRFTIGWGQAQCARQAWRSCGIFSQEPGRTRRDG